MVTINTNDIPLTNAVKALSATVATKADALIAGIAALNATMQEIADLLKPDPVTGLIVEHGPPKPH